MSSPKASIRELLRFARPQSVVISVALALGVLGTLASLAQPLAVSSVLDAITGGRSVRGLVVVLVLLFVADAMLSGLQSYLLGRTSEWVVFDLRRTLVGHLLRLPVPKHDRLRVGDLLSRVNTDATLLGTALTDNLANSLVGILTFIGAVVLMAILDPLLLLVALLCVLVAAASVFAVSSRVRAADEEAQRRVGLLGAALERALSAIRTVKVGRAEEQETRDISEEARAAYQAGVRATKLEAVVQPATVVAVQGSFVLVLGVGGARLASGAITLGELVAFLLYLLYLVSPLVMVFMSFTNLQRGLAAFGRIKEILDLPLETQDPPRGPIPDQPQKAPSRRKEPAVRFDAVRFGYVPGRKVLRGVSFEVPALSRAALVGPSGAGKSTVFALLERFYEADSGMISLGGVDVRRIPLNELRGAIAYVEQESPVMAGSVRSNLLYANPGASEMELEEALDLANLRPFVEDLPNGLDTEVGDGGVLLSGGERQRIAIARALLARPRLLLLDEITSQLDARNELALRETILRVSERCTVIVVAHRLSTVADADRIVVLDRGRVSSIGAHEELLAADSLYRELADNQLVKAADSPDIGDDIRREADG
jgi:ATP-binding cassette subfamily B protein/ATP-binding cassette subfamily C protein